jgi:hypothetical protein
MIPVNFRIWALSFAILAIAAFTADAQTIVTEFSDTDLNDAIFSLTEVTGSGSSAGVQLVDNEWYDEDWPIRLPLTITNTSSTDTISAGQLVFFSLDHATLVSDGDSLSNGDDVIVVHFDGTTQTVLPRITSNAWELATTEIAFKLVNGLATSEAVTGEYFLYYGNLGAPAPSDSGEAIYTFFEDFSRTLSDQWFVPSGAWNNSSDYLRYQGSGNEILLNSNTTFDDFEVNYIERSDATNISVNPMTSLPYYTDSGDSRFYFRATDLNNGYYFRISDVEGAAWSIYRVVTGTTTQIATGAIADFDRETLVRITVRALGNDISVYRDGTLLGSVTDATFSSGRIGFFCGEGRFIFDSVRLYSVVADEPSVSDGTLEPRTDFEPAGVYTSNVLDSGTTGNTYSTVVWHEDIPASTLITMEARASDSAFAAGAASPSWTSVTNNTNPGLTGRYIQYRATFSNANTTENPKFADIGFNVVLEDFDADDSTSDSCLLSGSTECSLLLAGLSLLLFLRFRR